MPYYSKEQIARAREMDLLTYLQNFEPGELVHVTGNTYSTREHDSLKISNGKWMWWSRGFGGASALDFLVKVRGEPFIDAVGKILGEAAGEPPFKVQKTQQKAQPEAKKKLLLPTVIILATFAANLFWNVNIMWLVLIDGIIGLFLLREAKYN